MKGMKSSADHFSPHLESTLYKRPYKYTLVIQQNPRSKTEIQNLSADVKLVYENLGEIEGTHHGFEVHEWDIEKRACKIVLFFDCCSYKHEEKRFRIIVDLYDKEKLISTATSDAFIIRAKKVSRETAPKPSPEETADYIEDMEDENLDDNMPYMEDENLEEGPRDSPPVTRRSAAKQSPRLTRSSTRSQKRSKMRERLNRLSPILTKRKTHVSRAMARQILKDDSNASPTALLDSYQYAPNLLDARLTPVDQAFCQFDETFEIRSSEYIANLKKVFKKPRTPLRVHPGDKNLLESFSSDPFRFFDGMEARFEEN